MEGIVFIDTHVLIWLYAGKLELLSNRAHKELQANDICISPVIRLELQYLYEIGRITESPDTIINTLQKEVGLKELNESMADIIKLSVNLSWTRDPFDRIITAHASLKGNKLITKDNSILSNYKYAIWD